MKQQWNHLKDIPFPHLAEKGVIDVLLGSDYYHLMFPMQEIRGQEDEPAARLCPLGWTAIGRIGKSTQPRGTAMCQHWLLTYVPYVCTAINPRHRYCIG